MEAPVKVLTVTLATPVELLVLIGGGEFSFGETSAVDEFLVSRIPSTNRMVAFLPTASGSAEYATHFGAYLRSIAPDLAVRNVPIYRGRDVRRQKSLNEILNAGMIYLGGGVAGNLLNTMRESPAEIALRSAASLGTIVAAIGASASCFGMHALDPRGGALPGLAWIRDTVIETGFDPTDDSGLRRLMSLPEVTLGLGIPAGTALAIHADGSTEIVGNGSIAVFRKG